MDSNMEQGSYGDFEFAGKIMEEYERKDSAISIETKLASLGTYSGLSDYDYQDLSNLTEGQIKELHQLKVLNKISIPNEVLENFKNIKCHCRMGLFPEIGRAWLTIDSDVYVWTYEFARDCAYFDGLNQVIVSVGLVKPKQNVFVNDVKYLLVLTTPVEVVVLGVTFGDTTTQISSPSRSFKSSLYEEMQLMNKPIFVVNCDSVVMSCVEGTADGRIFMGGRDGCLYEITYQAESNWFGKRCKKVNHSQGLMSLVVPGFLKVFSENDGLHKITVDNQRQILYTLSEKGAIEIWDISSTATRISRITQTDIANAAYNLVKTVDNSIFRPVVDICVLSSDEYHSLCLLAVTQSGVRLYFASSNYAMQQAPDVQPKFEPQCLTLQHVRLPPGYTPNAAHGKPRNVHSSYNVGGTVLLVSSPQNDQDVLWSLSSDPFLHTMLTPMTDSMRRLLAESSTTLHLDGQLWAISEMKEKSSTSISNCKDFKIAKRVVLLTNQGVTIVELLKSTDLLQQVLQASNGSHDAVKNFFEVHCEPEGCAISLMLSCLERYATSEIGQWATQAFFRFGGEPTFVSQPNPLQQQMMQGQHEPQRMFMSTPYNQSRPASSIQQNLMLQTQFGASSSFNQTMQNDFREFKFSAKHGALYTYVARLLRPIWTRKCIDKKLSSTISFQDCNELLTNLFALRSFMEVNSVSGYRVLPQSMSAYNSFAISSPSVTNGMSGSQIQTQHQRREEALAEEKQSMDALLNFIKYVCEIISLWKILCEHQIHILVTQLSAEHRQNLENCNFRELILYRSELCAVLILTIINSYLNDNASVKSVSEKLRELCPTLYRNEDAISHKATEILKLSKTCANDDDRIEHLNKALELCRQAAPKLPLNNICQQFTAAGFYEGVIKLCTVFAAKLDPNEAAIHFYKNNYPFDIDNNQMQGKNTEEFLIFNTRSKCYEEVKNMLQQIFTSASQGDGHNNNQFHQVLNMTLSTDDILLHVAVYEWMLQNNLYNEMLKVSNSSLGDFLGRSINRSPINFELADLLWKYYEKNGQHHAAAKILDKLATMPSESVPLSKRIEYLARAVMSMRSDTGGYAAHQGEFLRDLEDKLDIAQVQKQIFGALSNGASNVDSASMHVREALKALNSRLFNMSQLYSEFAECFNLWECQLTILNCSHHNEPRLINSVWSNILDNELNGSERITEKPQRILSKVQSLANEFGVGPCFPLGFIIEQLELRFFELGIPNSPLPEALMMMNLDVDQVLDSYNKILTSNDRVWLTGCNELYLIESVTKLLYLITHNLFATNKNRRRTTTKIEDLISATLTALYTKQSTAQTKKITDELRNMRESISNFN